MTSEVWLDEFDDPIRTITWTYDDAGRLLEVSDPDSTYAFTYDLLGRVLTVDNDGTPNLPRVILNFTYNYAGDRTAAWDNHESEILYSYADNRLTGMQWTTPKEGTTLYTVAQVGFAYDSIGRLTTVTRGEADEETLLETGYVYDDLDRLTGITHASVLDQVHTELSEFLYTFDVNSRITSYTGPEGTLNYAYDPSGQLLDVTGARSEDYSYDENGNRTMTGYVTGDLNQLLSDGVYDYEYDLEGNMISKTRISDGEVTEYTWDHRQRLVHVVVKEADEDIIKEVWYTYDVFDRRIGVIEDADGFGQDPAVERWTVYDGDNPWADFDDGGSLTTRYLYGPAIDQIFARIGESGDVDWYLTDHLGSVRQIVQTDSTIVDEIDYDSFGQILNETSPANGDRFKYTAREWDAIVGQYYYRARYYAPDTGRFLSEDPLRFEAGDTNLYRYVFNIPTSLTDPSGQQVPAGGGWGGNGIGGVSPPGMFERPRLGPGGTYPWPAGPRPTQGWWNDPAFGDSRNGPSMLWLFGLGDNPRPDWPWYAWYLHMVAAGSELPGCGTVGGRLPRGFWGRWPNIPPMPRGGLTPREIWTARLDWLHDRRQQLRDLANTERRNHPRPSQQLLDNLDDQIRALTDEIAEAIAMLRQLGRPRGGH
jgi:RHS repeat-associated protein